MFFVSRTLSGVKNIVYKLLKENKKNATVISCYVTARNVNIIHINKDW